MKLATFKVGNCHHWGIVTGDEVLDVSQAAGSVFPTLRSFLEQSAVDDAQLQRTADLAESRPLSSVELIAPIPDSRLLLGIGFNYASHAEDMGRETPDFPVTFVKSPSALTGPYGDIYHSGISDTLDYEGELGLVVGRTCRNVKRAEARDYLAGALVLNDLSLREYVVPNRFTLAKSGDGFAPMGPWMTTVDEIPDLGNLQIKTWVNGELRQDANTSDMIFAWDEIVETISRFLTLQPGDIILTGSPQGSGIAFDPPKYLQAGDRIRVEIDDLGVIENEVKKVFL